MRRTGFTLLELLVVLAIITTLFGLGLSSFQRQFARTQFKSGVFELQIDLAQTRLLAMKTGTPYLFRFAPGSGVYEIAPVKTVQEAIYRSVGDADSTSGARGSVGGSLNGFSNGGALGARTTSRAADDLFSPENVAADAAAFRGSTSTGAVSTGVGGGLQTPFATGALDFSTSGGTTNALSTDAALGGFDVSAPPTLRDLNADEKEFANANLLAWRVDLNGAIFRKELSGDVVFTFERVSKSTPSNLKTRRPSGLDASNGAASADVGADDSERFRSELTGSLTKPPSLDATTDGDFDVASASASGGLFAFDGANVFGESTAPSPWSEPIVFYPNGRTSTAVLGLACGGDYRFYSEIAIRGLTGVARVSSISALEPGVDPTTSALTPEALFRLTNPGADASANSDKSDGGLSGGSLGDVSSGDDAGRRANDGAISTSASEIERAAATDGGSR